MAKTRLTRKQLLKEPDEFITLTGRTIQWSRQNAKALLLCGVALLVAMAAVSGYLYYNQNRETAAAAPVVVGIMERAAARARLRSLCGRSRMRWSLV